MAAAVFMILAFCIGNSYSEEFPQGTIALYGQSNINGGDTLEASRMMGAQVTDSTGNPLGQISDLVIDSGSGHISEVILTDVPGEGGKQIAVPIAALSHTDWNSYVFNKPEEYPSQFSSVGGPYFTQPFTQWAQIRFLYSVLPLPMGAYRFSNTWGTTVRTPNGEVVGRVNDLVIDFTNDHVVYSVLSDVEGRGGDMVAVPYGEFSKGEGATFTLRAPKEKLMDSPAFTWNDVGNLKYAENIYKYYGVQPYWEEK